MAVWVAQWYRSDVPFDLVYWPQADDELSLLENDVERGNLATEVNDTLARLADDPGDPRLRSTTWQTETYGVVHTTPVGDSDWRIVWSVGPDELTLEIRYLGTKHGPSGAP